jgi:tetratricopeptide (TPR) repeat protein
LYEDLLLNARSQAVADSARIYLAGMMSDVGEHGRAIELYTEYAEANPSRWPETLYRMIEVHDVTGAVEESRKDRLRLMEGYPAHRSSLDALRFGKTSGTDREQFARALVYFRHGQQGRARKTLDRLLRSGPDNALTEKARYLQARCYLKGGDYQRAQTAFDRLFHEYGSPEDSCAPSPHTTSLMTRCGRRQRQPNATAISTRPRNSTASWPPTTRTVITPTKRAGALASCSIAGWNSPRR